MKNASKTDNFCSTHLNNQKNMMSIDLSRRSWTKCLRNSRKSLIACIWLMFSTLRRKSLKLWRNWYLRCSKNHRKYSRFWRIMPSCPNRHYCLDTKRYVVFYRVTTSHWIDRPRRPSKRSVFAIDPFSSNGSVRSTNWRTISNHP